MENRSPYVLVGAAMLLFIAALVGFVVWKLRAGDRTAYAYYFIRFSEDVQGLTVDSGVFYKGLRVGRVHAIELKTLHDTAPTTGRERIRERIEVTVAVNADIDVRENSYAVFERPFIAGSAFVQIVPRNEVDVVKSKHKVDKKPYPEIREGTSFIQETSTSARQVLAKSTVTVDQLNKLLSDDNIASVKDMLKNLSTVTAGLAKQDGAIQTTLAELPGAVAEINKTFDKVNKLTESLGLIAMELGPQDAESKKALAGREPSELRKTIGEARSAMANIDSAAGELNKILSASKGPVRSFTETGLNELSLAIRELRQLTANINIIATKLERDPAGFVFSGKQGYTPK